jgi:hypothetical protein
MLKRLKPGGDKVKTKKEESGRIKLPRGTTANERAKVKAYPGEKDRNAFARIASKAVREARENPQGILQTELENLIDAAELVVERWSKGDLADAVNGLRVDAENAKARLALIRSQSGISQTVKLTVIGGIAEAYEVPKGVTVEVHDYDCDAIADAPDIKRDKTGDRYILKVWEGK